MACPPAGLVTIRGGGRVKIACLQEHLAQGLSIVGRAVSPRSALPVLGNILLASDEGRLKLAATNQELTITCWTDAEVKEPGAITIPARLLGEFVGSLPKERIELALHAKTGTLNLRCATYEANVKGIDAEEFPPIPEVGDHALVSLDPKLLHEAIGQVAFAAATDDSRPALAGVLLSFREQALTLAAADGFRLAVRRLELAEPVAESVDIIVPARALAELARILGDQEEPIRVSATPNRSQVLFRLKDVELVSRLIEASFPNYQQIIPTSHATRGIIDTKVFASAIRIASFFARDSSNIVRLQVTAGGELTPGTVKIEATATDVGDTSGSIDAVVEGDATQIAFNAKYLADVLAAVTTTQVSLECTSPSRPGVIRPVGSEGYTYVIMPMHVTPK
jgi:DNA polymerase-3 subunit beta